MTNEQHSGSDRTPSFGAFIETPSGGSSSPDNSAQTPSSEAPKRKTRRRSRSSEGGDSTPPTAEKAEAAAPGAAEGSPSESSAGSGGGEEGGSRPRSRRRGSRGGRGRKKTTTESRDEAVDAAESTEPAARAPREAEPAAEGETTTRRKRSRRGRRSKRSGAEEEGSSPEPAEDSDESVSATSVTEESGDGEQRPEGGTRKKRSRRKRSSSRSRAEGEEPESERASEAQADEEATAEGEKKRRRRGSRGGKKRSKRSEGERGGERAAAAVFEMIPGEEDDLPELPELPDDAELIDDGEGSGSRSKRKSRSRRKKGSGVADDADDSEETSARRTKKKEVVPDRQILVNAADREETRVAVVKDQRILDFQMNVESDKSLVNDIYRGRVVNLEASIGAAFIDFGRGRNGFLHTSDVLPAYGEKDWDISKLLSTRIDADEWDENSSQPDIGDELEGDDSGEGSGDSGEEKRDSKKGRSGKGRSQHRRPRPRKPIKDMLKVGDRVIVQVTKDAIGDKGPTLTTYISIPGRYHVLMPSTEHRGVSRKIEDVRERRRLKKILDGLEVPDGMGVIARTAAKGCTKVELKRDLDYLLDAWNRLAKKITSGHGPLALYQESDVAIRTVRDLFGPQTESVIVDEPKTFERVKEFAELLMPEHVDCIKLHDGDRPLFHSAGIEQEFERIFSRRIELPSGGSIVFDQAEALVAIDVNSGKTRTSSHDFEEIALKTNMEAVPEIARQIRLRDLGGIIVVDFIDMMKNSNRKAVEKAFRDQLALDRARSKVGRISQFGLLEMTRQRLGPGMSKKLFTNCPACRGQGRVRTAVSRAASILRRLGSAMTLKGFSSIEVRAQADALEYLKKEHQSELDALEKKHNRSLKLVAVADQLEDSVLRYLRADGREVRPGGRRKR